MLFLSLLLVGSATGKPVERFHDFSHKGADYAALENLRFAATDISYVGTERVDILGQSYEASKYLLPAVVEVQVLDAVGPVNTEVYEKRPVEFDVFVIEDRDRTIHDELVKEIYDSWSRKELFSGHYFFDFSASDNHYVLSAMPDLVNVKCFYFVWVNGRAVKISCEGKPRVGWGVMDGFTEDNLRISFGDVQLKVYQYPLRAQKKFIKLYEKGFFKSTKSGR